MPTGYCTADDVRQALQEEDLSGSINSQLVEPGIYAASRWFRRRAKCHVYDSQAATGGTIPAEPLTADTITLDVPSSPHRQDRQLHHGDDEGQRYPVTQTGPYTRIRLPHKHVQSITSLGVRDLDGDRTDWTADPEIIEGVGEDYYVEQDGRSEVGRSYLYVRAASIGPRVDFEDLLTVGYEYGLDAQTDDWWDIRRGVANLAAMEVLEDDNVISQIPDNARLPGVQTEYDHYLSRANKYLNAYLSTPIA